MTDISFSPARPVRAYAQVAEQIETAIMSGELTPGSRLPSERELVDQFQVGRSTVREALRVLESDGFIRSRAGDPRGAEVLAFSPHSLDKQLTRMVRLDGVSISELVEFRIMTETLSCRLAAQRRTEAELAGIKEALAKMERARALGPDAFGRADLELHRRIAGASHNRFIEVCLSVVRREIFELIRDTIRSSEDADARMATSVDHDATLYAAIEAGDSKAAGKIIQSTLLSYYSQVNGVAVSSTAFE